MSLEYLDIEYQDATRPIKVVVIPATDSTDGTIMITDYYTTSDVIVSVATSRTIGLDMHYGTIGQPVENAPRSDKPRRK